MSDRIHVLSLHRPWLAAFFQSDKRLENRSKPPPKNVMGKWVAFHAAKAFDHERLPLIAANAPEVSLDPKDHPTGLVGMAFIKGYALSIDEVADDQRRWWLGPVAYLVPRVIEFDEEFREQFYVPNRKTGVPGPAPGQQGWKFLSDEHVALIREMYGVLH